MNSDQKIPFVSLAQNPDMLCYRYLENNMRDKINDATDKHVEKYKKNNNSKSGARFKFK